MKTSGVPLIDQVIGGIAPGMPLIVTGPTGSGRTVLALQLLAASLERGERTVLLGAEPPPLVLREAAGLALPLDDALADGRLVMLEMDPRAAAGIRSHGGEALAEAIRTEAPDAALLVVDPISSLTYEVMDEADLRALLQAVFGVVGAGAVLATVDASRLEQDAFLSQALNDLCGALVRLDRARDGSRTLVVEKSRASAPDAGRIHVAIAEGGMRRVERSDAARPAAADALAPASRREPRSGPRRGRIVVVQPREEDRRRLDLCLGADHELVFAEDGYEGLTAVLSERPDLVILDLDLPRVSGNEVIQALRASGATIPVLIVSSHVARTSDRVRALVLGAADCLPAPVNAVELRHKVETLLALPEGPPRPPEADEVGQLLAEGTSSRVLDTAGWSDRLGRALRFGIEFGFESSVLALEADGEESLQAALAAVDEVLRTEDAVLQLDATRVLVLLVLTPLDRTTVVLERLQRGLERKRVPLSALSVRLASADEVAQLADWKRLFDGIRGWPDAGSR